MVGGVRIADELPANVLRLDADRFQPRRRSVPDKLALLRHVPPFGQLDAAGLDRVARESREIELRRGMVLFQKGEPDHGLFAVVYGQVKLAFPAPNGNEKVLDVLGPREVFGECALFQDGVTQCFTEALTDSLLLFVPRAPVLAVLDGQPLFARGLFELMAGRLRLLVKEVESLAVRTGKQRVIDCLRELFAAAGGPQGASAFSLPTSKQVLAARLNLMPETLSRFLGELVDEGLIAVEGRRIVVLDPARLAACHDPPLKPDAARKVS